MYRFTYLCLLSFVFFNSCEQGDPPAEAEYVVINTFSDESEPYLNVRSEKNNCSKTIGRIKDGTRVYMLEDSGDYVKIQTVPLTGYVHKSYIIEDDNLHSNPAPQLKNMSFKILEALKGDLSKMKPFINQDSIRFFYWDLPVCDLKNSNCYNLVYSEYDYVRSSDLMRFSKKVKTRYMNYRGLDYFPSAGFGGGSVSSREDSVYTVTIGQMHEEELGDEIWFSFKASDSGFSLIEIGNWIWMP